MASEPWCVSVAKQQVANFGEQTVGAHHQVVTTAAAIGEQHFYAVALFLQGFDTESKAYVGAQFKGGFAEHFMQRQTGDADVCRIGRPCQSLTRDARQLLTGRAINGDVFEGIRRIQITIEHA
ncbi:hypothetical protein D3C85_1635070 [compost metagenome]